MEYVDFPENAVLVGFSGRKNDTRITKITAIHILKK